MCCTTGAERLRKEDAIVQQLVCPLTRGLSVDAQQSGQGESSFLFLCLTEFTFFAFAILHRFVSIFTFQYRIGWFTTTDTLLELFSLW